MGLEGLRYLVVGAGFFGAVIAERIATVLQEKVLLIDKRSHPGGNSYSHLDEETGIEIHDYGTHIFHTSNVQAWSYINRFTSFNHYRHRVLAKAGQKTYTMPVNLDTIERFYERPLSPAQAYELIQSESDKESLKNPSNFEEQAVALVGRKLYQALFRGYTLKQWGTDPKLLPASFIMRLPVRYDYRADYFDDAYQGLPTDGYGKLFQKMLMHQNIELRLKTDFFELKQQVPSDCTIVYTGPIDRYFNCRMGALGWRTLRLEFERLKETDFQGIAVMNYTDDNIPFTRIHESKHLHPERNYPKKETVICREFSCPAKNADDPYYPIQSRSDKEMLSTYRAAAEQEKNVIFGGRLGAYKYLNMDQVIADALDVFEKKISQQDQCL